MKYGIVLPSKTAQNDAVSLFTCSQTQRSRRLNSIGNSKEGTRPRPLERTDKAYRADGTAAESCLYKSYTLLSCQPANNLRE
jgi:hypothetical protein